MSSDTPQRSIIKDRVRLTMGSTTIVFEPALHANVRYYDAAGEARAKVVVSGDALKKPWPTTHDAVTDAADRLAAARTTGEVFEIIADLMATLPVA